MPAPFVARTLPVLVLLLILTKPASADWPTLHGDYQRSGYSEPGSVGQPLERKWYRSLVEEAIGPRCEAIVGQGLCFIGTYAGNLYALDVASGKTVWQAKIGGAIGHSPCYHDGRVYVASDDGFRQGSLVCLNARDGAEVWRYRAAAGIWNSPACDGRRVFVGDREGVFHAVDASSGEKAWTFTTGAMILEPASFSPDGQRIVVGSEDMHVYCLDIAGKLLWRSSKLAGLSQRDAAPTIWQDKVIVRTNPSLSFHAALHEGRDLVSQLQRQIPLDPREDVVYPNIEPSQYFLRCTARREKAESEGVIQYLKQKPDRRTWFTFNLSDGREPWITSVLFTSGLHNPPSPPAFNPKGELYTIMVTALGVYADGVSQVGIGIGRIDAETGYLTNVPHAMGDKIPGYWGGMTMIADETSSISLMGETLFCTHQGAIGTLDLPTRKLRPFVGLRDSYGGLYGPGAHGGWDGSKKLAHEGYVQNTTNEWHGPDRSIVAISDNRMFWVVGGCVVCLGGPDIATTDTGGQKPPAPWKWKKMPRTNGGNVTSTFGAYDESAPRKELTAADVEPYLATPSSGRRDAVGANEVTARLDAAALQLVAGEPWAPWIVQLGISKEEYHFVRSADEMRALAMALPYLSSSVRAKAIAYLDKRWQEGVPLDKTGLPVDGRRREHYDLAPELLAGIPAEVRKPAAKLGDLYAVWTYAEYADRWDRVLAKAVDIRQRFGDGIRKPSFDPNADKGNAVATLNADLAGAIAYARIMRRAEQPAEADAALAFVARQATERVHFEKAEGRLHTIVGLHAARMPRYEDLTPEIGRLLADHAGAALRENLADLDRELPVWYQAWGERQVGGENYINSPRIVGGLFLARAYGLTRDEALLERYLDQPWCKADLYYIEKLAAMLAAGE